MARGKRTPANPGRANINLGGILGAAGAGSDNPSFAENVPANPDFVTADSSGEDWQNFMDTSRDGKYLSAGGVLTSNPAADTRNWIQRVTGKPDVAGSINANLLAQRSAMPLQQQQATFESGLRTNEDAAHQNLQLKNAAPLLIASLGGNPNDPQHVKLALNVYEATRKAATSTANLQDEGNQTNILKEQQGRPAALATALNTGNLGQLKSEQSLLAQRQPEMQGIVNKSALGAAAMPAIEANNKSAISLGPNETRFQPATPFGDNQNKEYTGSRQVNTLVQQWMNPKGEISDMKSGPKDYPFGTPRVQQGFTPAAIMHYDAVTGTPAIQVPKAGVNAPAITPPAIQPNVLPTPQQPKQVAASVAQPQQAQTQSPILDTSNTFSNKQQENLNDSAYYDKTGTKGKAMAMQYLKDNIKDLESKLANSQGGSDMVAMKQRLAALMHVLQTN